MTPENQKYIKDILAPQLQELVPEWKANSAKLEQLLNDCQLELNEMEQKNADK